jgi:serine/threonine protein kinase
MVGRYRIVRLLGRGSNAEVFRAADDATGQEVALKLLHTLSDDPTLVEHFQREMAQVARLQHPNIASVHAFGIHDERFYIVIDLIEGTSLRDVLSERRDGLAFPKALDIFQQVAVAVGYAHTQGVIHLSIRPSNILLASGVRPMLVDFGMAEALAGDNVTTAEFSSRAPIYMSPEQAAGREITPQADIYALGILLYEMTTGDVPFKGNIPARIMVQHLQAEPRPPIELKVDLDPRVNGVILQALAKEPGQRFATPQAMLEALTTEDEADNYDTVNLSRTEAKAFRQELIAARDQLKRAAPPERVEIPVFDVDVPVTIPAPLVEPAKENGGISNARLLAAGVALVVIVLVVILLLSQGAG